MYVIMEGPPSRKLPYWTSSNIKIYPNAVSRADANLLIRTFRSNYLIIILWIIVTVIF